MPIGAAAKEPEADLLTETVYVPEGERTYADIGRAKVVRVSEGDLIYVAWVDRGRVEQTPVRLRGFTAPETRPQGKRFRTEAARLRERSAGEYARNYLAGVLMGRIVSVRELEPDPSRPGRVLARVIHEGRDVAVDMCLMNFYIS